MERNRGVLGAFAKVNGFSGSIPRGEEFARTCRFTSVHTSFASLQDQPTSHFLKHYRLKRHNFSRLLSRLLLFHDINRNHHEGLCSRRLTRRRWSVVRNSDQPSTLWYLCSRPMPEERRNTELRLWDSQGLLWLL